MPTLKRSMILSCFLLLACIVQAQTRTISGKVTSVANEAQPGASVIIKGKSKGVATDANGTFSISAPSGAVTLVVSTVGFATMEKNVGANKALQYYSIRVYHVKKHELQCLYNLLKSIRYFDALRYDRLFRPKVLKQYLLNYRQ